MMFTFQVPLGIMFKNENVHEDMVSILQQFFCYLPKTVDGGVGQLFSGDQLTVERAFNVISSVASGLTTQDRLEGINLQLGNWRTIAMTSFSTGTNRTVVNDIAN